MSKPKRSVTTEDAAPFELAVLGTCKLKGPAGPIELSNRKLCAVLAYLVYAAPQTVSRETLKRLLWAGQSKAQADQNLNQMISRLRRLVGEDAVLSGEYGLAVKPGVFRCDATEFKNWIGSAERDARAAAVGLYRGSFAANIAVDDETWVNWVGSQRQQLEALAVDGLVQLAEEEEAAGDMARSLGFANRAVGINDLREDAHRIIIRSLAAEGRRAEALQHYAAFAARLERAFGVGPDTATGALVASLRRRDPTGQAATAESVPPSHEATGGLPSIAVLPFQNLGLDASDDYFADGVVEDIIVSLASLRELLVIARASTLVFKGREVDPREVGKNLDVRYVLQGSVRKNATTVRVSTHLSDAETGASVWAERHEVSLGDLFGVQDQIVHAVVARIAPNVQTAELERALRIRPTSFTAYDHTLRALAIINNLDRDTFWTARDHLNKALTAHPSFAMPAAWGAFWGILWVGQGWSDNPRRDSDEAAALAAKAIDLDGSNALALATYGHVRSFLFHDYDSALVYFDRALAACPNSSWAWILSSATLSYVGRGAEAVRHAERGLRLSPYDRSLFFFYATLAIAHYTSGNYETSVKWGRMAVAENSAFTAAHRYLAAALAATDRLDDAREAASTLLRLEPGFKVQAYERTRQPFRHPEAKARHLAHLRRAGLPR